MKPFQPVADKGPVIWRASLVYQSWLKGWHMSYIADLYGITNRMVLGYVEFWVNHGSRYES